MSDPTRPAIDVHIHLHPPRLARAIERHFADRGWAAAHPFDPAAVAATLAAHGVTRFCCSSYAHRAGIAREINRWMAETAAQLPAALPLGTVHPDDDDPGAVATEALGPLGCAGVKIHCSVQRVQADDPRLHPVYEQLVATDKILLLHAGTMPYRDAFTGAAHVRGVLERFPTLRLCVAHLGEHEHRAFFAMLDDYPRLYLDTTMALSESARRYVQADPDAIETALFVRYQDRILFGSDFPLLPYAYEEERRWAAARGLPVAIQRKIFHDNACRFLSLVPQGGPPGPGRSAGREVRPGAEPAA